MSKAKVFFTKEITPQAMIRMYEAMGVKLPGKVAVKLHSGEVGNQNFLRPDFMKPVIDHVKGTIVECNTAYEGKRNTTEAHWETMKLHGWTGIADVDILDEEGEMELPLPGGKKIKRISWARTWGNMIPCWCCPISKDIPWEDSGAR